MSKPVEQPLDLSRNAPCSAQQLSQLFMQRSKSSTMQPDGPIQSHTRSKQHLDAFLSLQAELHVVLPRHHEKRVVADGISDHVVSSFAVRLRVERDTLQEPLHLFGRDSTDRLMFLPVLLLAFAATVFPILTASADH